jgi:hypothetical protein
LDWKQLPSHYVSLFPYIKQLDGQMSQECFRQMVFCRNVESDGMIEAPFKAYCNVSFTSISAT